MEFDYIWSIIAGRDEYQLKFFKNSIRTELGVDVDLLWNTIRYLKNGEYSGPCKDRASNGLSQRRLRISDYSNSSSYSINNDLIDSDDEC